MPSVSKKTVTRWVDRRGKRVEPNAPGAKKVSKKTKKWYGFGIPGLPPGKGVPLTTDRTAARRMLDDLVRAAERGMAGLPDRRAARTPLAEYADRFEADLALGLASRSRRRTVPDAAQVALVRTRLDAALAGCDFRSTADLGPEAPRTLARWLAGKVAAGRAGGGFSHQTAAFHLAAARRFVWWLGAKANAPVREDLFADVPGFDPGNNRVHPRRTADEDELAAVLAATRASTRPCRRLSGTDRYFVYLVAFATGFRCEELSRLTPANFDLAADPPTVALAGRLTKNKKAAAQPLPAAVAAELSAHLAGRPPADRIWPGRWWRHAARMLRKDLKAAGVPYEVTTHAGPEYLDFHALRHSFVTALANANVGPKLLQVLARHSDPRLTLGLYAHARNADLAAAVGKLPLPGGKNSPLADLTRGQLEDLALGLAGVVAILVATPVAANGRMPSEPVEKPAGGRKGRGNKKPLGNRG